MKKIGVWYSISESILNKNRLKKIDTKSEKYFFKNLSKIGYSLSPVQNITKKKFFFALVKSFQRRYRQQLVNGKVDMECFLISENLAKKLN